MEGLENRQSPETSEGYYHATTIIMAKKSKNYRNALEKIDKNKFYTLSEGIKLVKETNVTKFDGSIEIHFKLGIDPKKADQAIRTTVSLPHGTGKSIKIAAIVSDDKIKSAKDAGATNAGLEDLIAEFKKGKFDYDIVIATPDVMKKIGPVAKTLGQKGLMPNPKSGTVTTDIEGTIKELIKGRVELRNDKEGNIHSIAGKNSFDDVKIEENLTVILKAIRELKPSAIKGTFIKSITLASTMGPGVPLEVNEVLKELGQ